MKEHVEAARKALDTWTNKDQVVIVGTDSFITIESAIRKLDRAGLLRTGLEKRAVEACERAAQLVGETATVACRYCRPPADVGRESLALKQPPKPRWRVSGPNSNGQCTVEGPVSYPMFTPEQAKAVAAALNACDTETRDA